MVRHWALRSRTYVALSLPKGDDAEDMCGNTLEPDPRYDSCCSNIFRPGKVLRDIIKGLLVVLGIAVVIAVVFVIIFYVVPGKRCARLAFFCFVYASIFV